MMLQHTRHDTLLILQLLGLTGIGLCDVRPPPPPSDGVWTTWTTWSACSVTCGPGSRDRSRDCHNPEGGVPCYGLPREEEGCPGIPTACPVAGAWSSWGPWGRCSRTCDVGTTSRSRQCDDPEPAFGGEDCEGTEIQTAACLLSHKCPDRQDLPDWSSWSKWSPCSESCGEGFKTRTRSCGEMTGSGEETPCEGNEIQNSTCVVQATCPDELQEPEWSTWEEWAACSHTCGLGTTRRLRYCNNTDPEKNVTECVGDSFEQKPCILEEICLEPEWSTWEEWATCSHTCGLGTTRRLRYCNNADPEKNGTECDGDSFEQRTCLLEEFCPLDGGWGPWSAYSICTVTCGVGIRVRKRQCNNPVPAHGGASCGLWDRSYTRCVREWCSDPDRLESSAMETTGTPSSWSEWGTWSDCSRSCGEGVTFRNRKCLLSRELCQGANLDNGLCFVMDCPVDGGWTAWSTWSACSVTCGCGSRMRTRTCDNPLPTNGGANCTGMAEEKLSCFTIPCPRSCQGGWSTWGDWSECTSTCGDGVILRRRDCDSPPPSGWRFYCVGKGLEYQQCNGTECGTWGQWSAFSVCSVTCGEGFTVRLRECKPETASCPGEKSDVDICRLDVCPDGKK